MLIIFLIIKLVFTENEIFLKLLRMANCSDDDSR